MSTPARLVADPARLSDREREIIDAAARLFNEHGYAATSIQSVAEAVGILKGSLFYYIDSKEDLLHAILLDTHERSRRMLAEVRAMEGDPLVRLRAFIEQHVLTNIEQLDKIGVFLHDFRHLSSERRDTVIALRDEYDALLRALVVEGQEGGVIRRDADPALVALAILGMTNWIYQWYRPGGSHGPAALAGQFADLALGGLASRTGGRTALGAAAGDATS